MVALVVERRGKEMVEEIPWLSKDESEEESEDLEYVKTEGGGRR